jgi:hypothetical protein
MLNCELPTQATQLSADAIAAVAALTPISPAPLPVKAPVNEVALTLPLMTLLPLVSTTPFSLTVWLIEAELGVKRKPGLYWAVTVEVPIPCESASSIEK